MAKKDAMVNKIEISVSDAPIVVKSMDDAVAVLEEMEEINAVIMKAQQRVVDLKKAATVWAVEKKADVIQLDGRYYRQIQRHSRSWDADVLKGIVAGMTVGKKGTPLWNFITRRTVNPEKIEQAVKKGYISEKKITKAFTEKPQQPFLQRYMGEGDDGE